MSLTDDELADLRQRIGNAMATLDEKSRDPNLSLAEGTRLQGKREGLALALDYTRAY